MRTVPASTSAEATRRLAGKAQTDRANTHNAQARADAKIVSDAEMIADRPLPKPPYFRTKAEEEECDRAFWADARRAERERQR